MRRLQDEIIAWLNVNTTNEEPYEQAHIRELLLEIRREAMAQPFAQ